MRLTLSIFFLLNFYCSFILAQNVLDKKINVQFEEETLLHCLKKIEKKENIRFSFNHKIISKQETKINQTFVNTSLSEILSFLLKDTGLSFKEIGGQITVYFDEKKKYTLSGHVLEKENAESLIGASIFVDSLKIGVISNSYGFYALTLPGGNHTIEITFIGKKPLKKNFVLNRDLAMSFELENDLLLMDEVTVHPIDSDKVESRQYEKIELQKIKTLPGFLGADLIKSIRFLPGIQSTGELSTSFYVRGGNSSQNLVLLDEAPIYFYNHMFGLISSFNSDAINSVSLYKGGIPAKYEAGSSSVLDIHLREGDKKKYRGSVGVGFLCMDGSFEGPLRKDSSSIIISGRSSLAESYVKNSSVSFYDLSMKYNSIINASNRVFFSAYAMRDRVYLSDADDSTYLGRMIWKNRILSTRWNHVFSSRLFSNFSLVFSDYSNEFDINGSEDISVFFKQEKYSVLAKLDLTYFDDESSSINFGFTSGYHDYSSTEFKVLHDSVETDTNKLLLKFNNTQENSFYIERNSNYNNRLHLNYGIRMPFYVEIVPSENIELKKKIKPINIFDKVNLYLEPRINLTYRMNHNSIYKLSYHYINQFQHLFQSNSAVNLLNFWTPSSDYLKPEIINMVSLGRKQKFSKYDFSVDIYYKWMNNVYDFADGKGLLDFYYVDSISNNLESSVLSGKGWSQGVELQVGKNVGSFTGWISYTLSKTDLKIDGINNNHKYPAPFDRRHNCTYAGIWDWKGPWKFSSTFILASGRAYTFPNGEYEIQGKKFHFISDRNSERTPIYHRLDISFIRTKPKKKSRVSEWSFSVFNVYNHHNPEFYYIRDSQLIGINVNSITPYVTYKFKF